MDPPYTSKTVAALAEALWSPNLQVFILELFNGLARFYGGRDCCGRRWVSSRSFYPFIKQNTTTSDDICFRLNSALQQRTKYDKLTRAFEVTDLMEVKFEKWIKLLADAKGEIYVPPDTREEKRKGWNEAIRWFEKN